MTCFLLYLTAPAPILLGSVVERVAYGAALLCSNFKLCIFRLHTLPSLACRQSEVPLRPLLGYHHKLKVLEEWKNKVKVKDLSFLRV